LIARRTRRIHLNLIITSAATSSDAAKSALCSIAISFRVTQVVDIVRGVHAMIPKHLFAADLRKQITVV